MLSALRNFLITFVVSLLIFGLLAYFITTFIVNGLDLNPADDEEGIETVPSTSGISNPSSDSGSGITDPVPDDSLPYGFTVLLIGSDYQPDILDDYDMSEFNGKVTGFPVKERVISADMIVLVHINRNASEFVFCALPSNLKVSDQGLYRQLGELYGEYGAEYLCGKVMALTGIPVNYYISAEIPGFEALIDELGGITYYVPQDMYYEDPEQDLVIDLKRGSQLLDGAKTMQMLRFNSYDDSGSARRTMALNFLKSMLLKFTEESYFDTWNELLLKIVDHIDTNVTEQVLADNLPLLFAYQDYAPADIIYPCSNVIFEGTNCFEPNIPKAWSAFSKYKFKGE